MAKWCCRCAIVALMVGCVGWLAGCDKKTTTQTEVKDRLLGGKESEADRGDGARGKDAS